MYVVPLVTEASTYASAEFDTEPIREKDPPVDRYTLYPEIALPELAGALQVKSTSCWTAVPEPLSVTTVELPVEELLPIVTWPEKDPALVGANCICIVVDWFGLRVTGKLPLVIVNPAPLIVAELTVSGAVPVELIVMDWVVVVFAVRLPKLRFVALAVSWGLVATTPVPLNDMTVEPPDVELLLIVT